MTRHEVRIEQLGHDGDGIVTRNGKPVYVSLALPGETVEIDQQDHRAQIVKIIEPSPDRVKAPCVHFGACGGCALQHWRPDAYQAWKREQISIALAHRGISAEIAPLHPASPNSRRRTALSARRTKSGILLGYHMRAAHQIVAVGQCPLVVPQIEAAFGRLAELLAPGLSRRGEATVLVTQTESGLDLSVTGGAELTLPLRQQLAETADAHDYARLVWNGEDIATRRPPIVRLGGIPVVPPPGAFLQPTEDGQAELTRLILAAAETASSAADLFSGCGTFSFALAHRMKVHAVESDGAQVSALEMAARNAGGTARLKPVTAERRDLFRRPLLALECNRFDLVVFDPPRSGAAAQSEELAKSKVPAVVAVSCNPATFARDARTLIDGGYRLERVFPVDQFLWSAHIELVGVFRRN